MLAPFLRRAMLVGADAAGCSKIRLNRTRFDTSRLDGPEAWLPAQRRKHGLRKLQGAYGAIRRQE